LVLQREEDEDFNSDNLDDDSENEQPVAASTRASTSKFPSEPTRKTATTRLTAKEKLAAKKKAKQAGTYQSGDEDDGGFSAPSRNFLSKPPIGSMDKCAKCGKKFTVVR
jgi:DNA repair protein RAD7